MKEFGPPGARIPAPLRSTTAKSYSRCQIQSSCEEKLNVTSVHGVMTVNFRRKRKWMSSFFYMGSTSRSIWIQPIKKQIFTARKRSLRRLCFYRCVSVHRGGWTGTPRDQVHPPGQVPNPRTRYNPMYTSLGRYTPGTRYTRLWDQVHSLDQVHNLWD